MNLTIKISPTNIIHCLFIISFIFGEQIKIFNVPLYAILTAAELVLIASRSRKQYMPEDKTIIFFAIFWLIVASVLLLFSYSRVGFHPWIYAAESALILIIITENVQNGYDWEKFIVYVFIAHILTCAFSTYELATGTHFLKYIDTYYLRMGLNNAFGFQVNINDNASVVAVGLFAVLPFLKKKKKLSIAVLIWSYYLLYRLGSRMCLLTCYVVIILAVLLFVANSIISSKRIKSFFTFFFVIIIIIIFTIVLVNENVFLSIFSDDINFVSDAARIEFMKESLSVTASNSLFLGNGPGVTSALIGKSIHSMPVEILCDYGIGVFAFFMYILIKMGTSFSIIGQLKSAIYITCFACAFFFLSFCSSSALHIRFLWVVFALVWKWYALQKMSTPVEN